jgi:hypothetical protein
MWKRLGQPLSGKQMAAVVALVLLASAAVYGLYLGIAGLWHHRMLEQSIPAALAGVRAQRDELASVIEAYKAHFGYYPPLYTSLGQNRGILNPLCYELLGTRYETNRRAFSIPITKDGLSVDEAQKYFNVHSFSNCLSYPSLPTNFLSNRALTTAPLGNDTDAFGVGVIYTEIIAQPFWEDFEFTTWRYTTNPAEHNPGKFDLWVEMMVAGKHFIIGNWPEVK